MPITGNFVNATVVCGTAGARIGCVKVDAGAAGENDWPMIVIELAREEERAGKAVVLRAVVAVVLVGGNGVPSEAVVLRDVSWQLVVMAEQDGLAIPSLDQLGRNGAIECPDRLGILHRHVRVEHKRN